VRRRRGWLRQVGGQIHYQNKLLVRSPSGPFFTVVVPLMLLVVFNLVYGHHAIPGRGGLGYHQFFTPSMIAFAIANACYVNLVTGVTLARDEGILLRVRGTPLRPLAYLLGRLGSATTVACVTVVAVAALGVGVYRVDVVAGSLAWAVVVALAGMACFCALGLMVSILVPHADAALPIAYGTLLPFSFVSDVFFPDWSNPHWLQVLASVFPLRPLARSVESAFDPSIAPWQWSQLVVLAAWTVGSLAVAVRWFRWSSTRERHRLRRPRRARSPAGVATA